MALDSGEVAPGVRTQPLNDEEREKRAEQVGRMRLIVAANATDLADCHTLLHMLGVHPTQADNEIAYS